MEEHSEAVSQKILSKKQVRILQRRSNGATYEQIKREFNLSGHTPIVHCILRTVQGYSWEPGQAGGSGGYSLVCKKKAERNYNCDAHFYEDVWLEKRILLFIKYQ
jgi:hypothetical protein